MTLILGVISGFLGLLVYGLLGSSASGSLTSQSYGMSLTSFLVTGVAFSSIITSGPAMFLEHSNPGELEEVLVTPTGFREYLLTSSAFNILTTLASTLLFFGLSIVILGLVFSYNVPLLVIVIMLGFLSSIGLGFIGLGLRLVYKQTSVLSWILFSMTGLLGNMIVPIQILPSIIQSFSYATPQYYFFTGIRVALGSNTASANFITPIFAMYTLVLLILGHIVLNYGMKFIRRNGTHRWN